MPTLPRPLYVAIQGEHGSYSEEATAKVLAHPYRIVPTRDFPHLFSSLALRDAHLCLAPMENSLLGSIFENYDLLLQFGYRVRAEVYLRVEHCLIAPVGTYLEDVRRVYSHPVALAQCQDFFRRHPTIETVSTTDTAGSVHMLVESGATDAAAIAGRSAAASYGAKILLEAVEDDPANYTRFFLLSLDDDDLDGLETGLAEREIGPSKTSIVFGLADEPGSLHAALAAFAERGIQLTKVESRPVRGRPFEYLFYVDFLGSPADFEASRALARLERVTDSLRVLGSYPSGHPDWKDAD